MGADETLLGRRRMRDVEEQFAYLMAPPARKWPQRLLRAVVVTIVMIAAIWFGTTTVRSEPGPEDSPEDVWLIHKQIVYQGVPMPGEFIEYENVIKCQMHIRFIMYASGRALPGCIIGTRDWLGNVTPIIDTTLVKPVGRPI